jgi:Glycosyl hydrolase family 26
MSILNQKLGGPPASLYGAYSQVFSPTRYEDSQITRLPRFQDIVNSEAVLVAAIMPRIGFDQFSIELCAQIATTMRTFTDSGVHVWLRFAHEMNWYVRDKYKYDGGTTAFNTVYSGTPAEFIRAWHILAEAVKDNDAVKMFWCPNEGDNIDPWWPGPDVVDIVGLDVYPRDKSKTFQVITRQFHDRYALGNNKPFALGETGVRGSDADFKIWWLSQLVDPSAKKALPNYIACSWFEFDKTEDEEGWDFRLMATDGSLSQARRVLLQK